MSQASFHKQDTTSCRSVPSRRGSNTSSALTLASVPQDLNAPEAANPYAQTCKTIQPTTLHPCTSIPSPKPQNPSHKHFQRKSPKSIRSPRFSRQRLSTVPSRPSHCWKTLGPLVLKAIEKCIQTITCITVLYMAVIGRGGAVSKLKLSM